ILWVKPQKRIAAWDDQETIWTTEAGLRRRTEERDDVENVQMRDNARRIGEAASYGDLSENSEYKFALEERDLLRARLAQINRELSVARLLTADIVPTESIGVGTKATLRNTADGSTRTITFLGPFDTNVDKSI